MQELNTALDKAKTFWNKPEGIAGKIFVILGVVAGGFGLWKLLPILLILAENTLNLVLMGIALFVVLYTVTNKQFLMAASTFFKMAMRSLTGMIIRIDPISIIKDYIVKLERQSEKFEQQMGRLSGQKANLRTLIEKNKRDISNNMNLAQEAKKRARTEEGEPNPAMMSQITVKTRMAARRQNSVMKFEELLAKMNLLYNVLNKYKQAADLVIEDKKDEVKNAEIEYNAIKQAYGAFSSAMSIIRGKTNERAIFEQSMEYIATEISMQVGEMERFAETSQEFMQGLDLQNGVFESKGLEMLEQWEKQADSLLIKPDDKEKLLVDANCNVPETKSNKKIKSFFN